MFTPSSERGRVGIVTGEIDKHDVETEWRILSIRCQPSFRTMDLVSDRSSLLPSLCLITLCVAMNVIFLCYLVYL